MRYSGHVLVVGLALLTACSHLLTGEPQYSQLWGKSGELWTPHSRLPDFSHAGYHEGDDPLPRPPVVCDVRAFGAKGDGKTDDTQAFRAAIAACAVGAIHIPAGRYRITDFLTIDKPGVVLRGDGPDKTILFMPVGIRELVKKQGLKKITHTTGSGLIQVKGSINSRRVSHMIEPALRGDSHMRIGKWDEVEGLDVGDQINVTYWAKGDGWHYLYAGDPGADYAIWARQVLTITGIDGDRLSFNRSLRFDNKSRITTFEPTVTEVGIEDLAIEFPHLPYRQHFQGYGFNAIQFYEVAHCWVRNVRIRNADNGVGTSKKCYFCTLSDIVLEADRMTDTAYIEVNLGKDPLLNPKQGGCDATGHHGLNIKGNDHLVTRWDLRTKFIHDITVATTMGCVISDGKGVDLCLDHHRMGPYENLWTNIDTGAGTRVWMSSGDGRYGIRCGARETFWNIRADTPQTWPKWRYQRWSNDFLNVIGLHTEESSILGTRDAPWPIPEGTEVRWFETMPPWDLSPKNLHQAQLSRRLSGGRPSAAVTPAAVPKADKRKGAQPSRPPNPAVQVAALPPVKKLSRRPPAWAKLPLQDVPRDEQICFAMYTLHCDTLKMTAFLYPLDDDDSRQLLLQVREGGQWSTVCQTQVREDLYGRPGGAKAWNALFRVEDWRSDRDWPYRVVALGGEATFEGTIRRNPVDKDEIVVAAFTGNSNFDRFPRDDIVTNVNAIDPDLLFFSGDQTYNHDDHMSGWLLFGRWFRDLIRHRPTVCIPDDHDVGQGNLWGAGGIKATDRKGNSGGYVHPAQYVREVEFAQTANLPDPVDPAPVAQGIGVYFTRLNVGGIDFAIIEDRKFKTGPAGKIPGHKGRPDHIRDPNFDTTLLDTPDAELLGDRQIAFLDRWCGDWENAQMKCVLSQTIFCNAANLHGGETGWMKADLDSNGWPRRERDRSLKTIRKGFAFMLSGDQHLATVVHHGVDGFGDSGYSFCVPSIVNHYGRWWRPREAAIRRLAGPLDHTGDYLDGFGNRMTMLAYANPGESVPPIESRNRHVKRATGYGITRFNKIDRTITMECWPRGEDVSSPDAHQYTGWPITIRQEDNYDRKAVAYLPKLVVSGASDPVVQVIDEQMGEVIYTLRIKGNTWQPKVFAKGPHTIRVGEGETVRTLTGLIPVMDATDSILNVHFGENGP